MVWMLITKIIIYKVVAQAFTALDIKQVNKQTTVAVSPPLMTIKQYSVMVCMYLNPIYDCLFAFRAVVLCSDGRCVNANACGDCWQRCSHNECVRPSDPYNLGR